MVKVCDNFNEINKFIKNTENDEDLEEIRAIFKSLSV